MAIARGMGGYWLREGRMAIERDGWLARGMGG